ncbi:unnamed protein product [Amaranthus hypochondriacus]
MIAPRTVSRELKPHTSASTTIMQNKHDKISVSRAAALSIESITEFTESTPIKMNQATHQLVTCEELQQNENADQMDSKNYYHIRDKLSQQQEHITKIAPGDGVRFR